MFGSSRLALYAANPVSGGSLVTGGTTYFTGGFGSLTTVRKYNMTTGASSAGTALPSSAALGQGWGSGVNGWQVGGFNGSSDLSVVRKMSFSGETWSTLTSLAAAQRNGRGTSSSTKGYSFGGYRATVNLSVNHQWTYSTDAYSSGTAMGWGTTPSSWAANHGTTVDHLFLGGGADGAGGTTKRLMSRYVFSTDTETYSATGGAYGHVLAGGTGNNTDMVVCGGYRSNADPTNYTVRGTTITRYVVSSGSVVVDSGTIGTAYSHGDAAGNDEVGIWAGSNGNEDRTQRENAYTYATNTDTLLSAYLANAQVATFNNMESPQAFHSGQIS